ncbi:MAG: DUF2461 domain-containing protein, partial [Pseudomonadota bacterium]
MANASLPQEGFELLDELAANNTKAWYADHRDAVKESLLEPFAAILDAVTSRLARTETPFKGSQATMFRMHRDVRFSKDKRPYKEAVAGLLTPSGDKNEAAGLAYVHAGAREQFMACGFYRMDPQALRPIRDAIIADPKAFSKMVTALGKSGLALCDEDSLRSMPRGYAEAADAPYAPALRLKSFYVRVDLPRAAWLDGSVVERIADHTRAS